MEEGLESDNGLDVSLCSAVLLSSSHSANTPHLTHRHHPCHVSVSLRSRFGPLVHVIRIRTCRERGSPSATYRGFHTLASQHPRNPKFNGRLVRLFPLLQNSHTSPSPQRTSPPLAHRDQYPPIHRLLPIHHTHPTF